MIADTLEQPIAKLENLANGSASVKYLQGNYPLTTTTRNRLVGAAHYRASAGQVIEYSKRYTTPVPDITRRITQWLHRFDRAPRPQRSVFRVIGTK